LKQEDREVALASGLDAWKYLNCNLSFCNLSLLYWIVRKRGMLAEGYCAAYLGMAALTTT